jgi:hypothetical protein
MHKKKILLTNLYNNFWLKLKNFTNKYDIINNKEEIVYENPYLYRGALINQATDPTEHIVNIKYSL